MIVAYYAHCIALYNTPQEDRDVELLTRIGFKVYNPNNEKVDRDVKALKAQGPDTDYMDYFRRLILASNILVFRALPDGSIPSGVAKEIEFAKAADKPIIEVPSAVERRTLSLNATREYLREVGQR